ncbi:MAG TPA: aminotransferase class I/II-fold pyridoxal phosphate-dependent enzyme [Gammaproteobacteria bacterium]|nr:aminotransferase class I/II-fold pyridoxal phosphate-dependent enzyme [Gammaproteobacteria bacterium]
MNGVISLLELVQQRATEFPTDTAYQFLTSSSGYDTLSYAELDKKARAIAATLQQHGCYNERAVLLLPPGLDYVAAFFGCLYAGAIAVPIYPPSKNRHLRRLLSIVDDAKAKFILTQEIFADQDFGAHSIVLKIDQIDDCALNSYQPVARSEEDLVFLQYTSGSTSNPKGVMVSYGNISANIAIMQSNFEEHTTVTCSWLPPYHDMGLVAGIMLPMYLKARAILMAPSNFLQSPLRWLEVISRERVELTAGPNFAYDLCVNKITKEQVAQLDLSCWKYAVNGAEPIRQTTLQRFVEHFAPAGFDPANLYPCYGLAEATLMLTGIRSTANNVFPLLKSELEKGKVVPAKDPKNQLTVNIVNCGHPQPEHTIRIVDPSTHAALPELNIGEIWASGPSIAKGYLNKPQLTQTIFHAQLKDEPKVHYMRTGDLGFMHNNQLYVTGRIKDLIIIRGLNYYPQDIEQTVTESHPSLQNHGAAAFSVEINNEEQLVVIQEVKREKLQRLDSEAVLDAIQEALLKEHGLSAHSIVLLKPYSLPKTSSGKVQRWSCRAEFLANTLNSVARWDQATPTTTSSCDSNVGTQAEHTGVQVQPVVKHSQFTGKEEAIIWLKQWFAQHLRVPAQEILIHKNLVDMGVNSLIAAELGSELYNKLGVRLDIITLFEQHSLDKLADFLTTDPAVIGKFNPSHASHSQGVVPLREHRQNLVKPLDKELLATVKNIYFKVNSGISTNNTVIAGEEFINYSGYNYLGMSGDKQVTEAVIQAVKEYGTSVSASRMVSGEKALHIQLERAISELIGAEDAAVLPSGYATNIAIITHLFGPGDLVVYDALSHKSILQGSLFSGATCMAFPHNDYAALEELLEKTREQYQRVLIVSEGAFSMDGDICDVRQLIAAKKRFETFLMLDEAHSMGVIGDTGRGTREYFNLNSEDVDIWMGTLSKSFASCGGYIAGTAELIENFKYSSAGFVYSAGISPANTAAALAAIKLMNQQPQRVTLLRQRHSLLLSLLKEQGIPTGNSFDTPIIPIMAGTTEGAIQLSSYLAQRKIYALPIFYPAVEKNLARIRLFVNCLHTEEQIRYTAKTIAEAYKLLQNSQDTEIAIAV